jgi:hypothetical protein
MKRRRNSRISCAIESVSTFLVRAQFLWTALAPRYYKANAVTGEARAAKYRTCEHCTCERCTGKGLHGSNRPSRIPFGKDSGSCDQIRDNKSDPSQGSIHAGPGLRDRWRRWWREFRRSETKAQKERERDREKQIVMQMEVEKERERDKDREKWGWGVAREEKRTSYF